MRTKKTNYLQVVVLLTSILFLIQGVAVFISPSILGDVFNINVNKEWFSQIRFDEFLFLIVIFSRVGSALLTVCGLSLIMPLYDPLRYRGLIYYMGALFPLLVSIFFIFNSIPEKNEINNSSSNSTQYYYSLAILGGIYLSIFILNISGLILTKKDASKGIE